MTEKTFDLSELHAEVIGIPGVKWEQAGRYYTAHGVFVMSDDAGASAPVSSPAAVPAVAKPLAPETGDFARMSNDQLRAQLAIYGGTWTNRADAIKTLNGDNA